VVHVGCSQGREQLEQAPCQIRDRRPSVRDARIDTSDVPPLTEAFWKNAVRNPFYRPVKQQVTVRVDADVLAWLRSAGRGYQARLNEILRQAMLRDAAKG